MTPDPANLELDPATYKLTLQPELTLQPDK